MTENHRDKTQNVQRQRLQSMLMAERSMQEALDEVERLHAIRTRLTSVIGECTTHGTGTQNARESATLALIEAEKTAYERAEAYASAVHELHAAIDSLQSDRQREVIRRRYVLGWSWKRIADSMGVKTGAVFHTHTRALEALERAQHETP